MGPLLVSNATAVQPLGFPFNNQHRGRSRVAPIDLPTPTEFVTQLSGEVEDITRELWNTVSPLLLDILCTNRKRPLRKAVFTHHLEQFSTKRTECRLCGRHFSGFRPLDLTALVSYHSVYMFA